MRPFAFTSSFINPRVTGFDSSHRTVKRASTHAIVSCSTPAPSRVLVLGGSGRVGMHTIRGLIHFSSNPLSITLAARNMSRVHSACRQLSSCFPSHSFSAIQTDITHTSSLPTLFNSFHLIIHAAGPFQHCPYPTGVLRAAMQAQVPYMDICDDLAHAAECKSLHQQAIQQNHTSVICTGINPGMSNLMAARICQQLKLVDSLNLYYHTAGSGGIGATVLASTFLLLSEHAVIFTKQGRTLHEAATQLEVLNFSGAIGRKTTYLLNLPEVTSLHDNIAPHGSVFAKFSTAPPIWNWLLVSMAKCVPKRLLRNREAMMALANFSLPVVRVVDRLSGARTAIVVKARDAKQQMTFSFEHSSLATCVGEAAAAFALELLTSRSIKSGVYYPEQLDSEVQDSIISNVSRSADFCEIIKVAL